MYTAPIKTTIQSKLRKSVHPDISAMDIPPSPFVNEPTDIPSETSPETSSVPSEANQWKWGQKTKYVKHFFQLSPAAEKEVRETEYSMTEIGKFIYNTHYARKMDYLPDSPNKEVKTEEWPDTVMRCTNSIITILKDYCIKNELKFKIPAPHETDNKFEKDLVTKFPSWEAIGVEMGKMMIKMKILPAGRQLWGLGSTAFQLGSMCLNNCAAVTTENLPRAVNFTCNALMSGAGVGFDLLFKDDVYEPNKADFQDYVIEDSREGMAKSLKVLVQAYVPAKDANGKSLGPETCGKFPHFDYSKIRAAGQPVKRFGGVASGPDPLIKLHKRMVIYFDTFLEYQKYVKLATGQPVTAELLEYKYNIFSTLVDKTIETDFSEETKTITLAHKVANLLKYGQPLPEKLDYYINSIAINNINTKLEAIVNSTEPLAGLQEEIAAQKKIYDDKIYNTSEAILDLKVLQLLFELKSNHDYNYYDLTLKINALVETYIADTVSFTKYLIRKNIELKTYDHCRLTIDIMNSTAAMVISGGIRRSSLLSLGEPDCQTFKFLKNFEINPERYKIAYMSNNSVAFTKTEQYSEHLPVCAEQTKNNGEPGYLFKLNAVKGRLGSHSHIYGREMEIDLASIPNPCGEILLLAFELCLLADIILTNFLLYNDNSEKEKVDTLASKFAYDDFITCCQLLMILTKAVSVLPTSCKKSNAIIARNHRVGIGLTGLAQAKHHLGTIWLNQIMKDGYAAIRQTDVWISKLLGVRESLRVTTIKPCGTLSLLAGCTPGIHYPVDNYMIRRFRYRANSEVSRYLIANGVNYETDLQADNTNVFDFYMKFENVPAQDKISLEMQFIGLRQVQTFWCDNMTSNTISFRADKTITIPVEEKVDNQTVISQKTVPNPAYEGDKLVQLLGEFAPEIKGCSFLGYHGSKNVYRQSPYEGITKEQYENFMSKVQNIDYSKMHCKIDTVSPAGCSNDVCLRT